MSVVANPGGPRRATRGPALFPFAGEELDAGTEATWAAMLSRLWPLVLLTTAAAVAAALLFTLRQPPRYRSHATLLVAPSESIASPADGLRALEALDRRSLVATLALVPDGDQVRRQAADVARLRAEDAALYRIRTVVVPNTTVLRIEVEGSEPDKTARLAQALADLTRDEVGRTYRMYVLRPLESARVPRAPSGPDLARNLLLGGAVGLAAGMALASLWRGVAARHGKRH